MAFQIIRACRALTNICKNTRVRNPGLQNGILGHTIEPVGLHEPLKTIIRHTTFFNKRPAESLWKSVMSVSNAGRKRGRGKAAGKRPVKNLNRGQIIGVGQVNMIWPGLTQPIMRGKELVQQKLLPEDPDRQSKLIKLRDSMTRGMRLRLHPLERGWSGGKVGGRSIGPPDPVGEETFEGFDSRVLEFKVVCVMTGNMGRKRSVSTMVVTGNGNGLAGFAVSKAPEGRTAMKTAKNRAAQKLMYIDRYENHTVMHDFFTQFGRTKIFVTKKPEGYGLVCHRAIKTCCEIIGIKNLHAKVEGSKNLQHIIKAFFVGLLQQKSMNTLAEEKKLHLVEFKEETGLYPKVIATPQKVRTSKQIPSNEILDFKQHVLGGKVVLKKKKHPPFYVTKRVRDWNIRLRKQVYLRNKEDVRLRMYAEHGELRSFLTDKYPEAKPHLWKKKQPAQEEEIE